MDEYNELREQLVADLGSELGTSAADMFDCAAIDAVTALHEMVIGVPGPDGEPRRAPLLGIMNVPGLRVVNRTDWAAVERRRSGRWPRSGPREQDRPGIRPSSMRARPDWFEIRNVVTGGVAEIYIYDEIGYWGVTAQDFARQLADLDVTDIDLRLNSPGGDAFDGIAIHNALRNHPANVTVTVDGLAASAASVIAMAGDLVVMGHGAQMMIHDASGICVGNATDMQSMADLLTQMSDNIAGFYAERAGGDVTTWRAAMSAETWYNGDEAVSAGLADEVLPTRDRSDEDDATQRVAARWDLSVFTYAGRDDAPAPGGSGGEDTGNQRRPQPVRPAARAVPSGSPFRGRIAAAQRPDPVPAPEPAVFEFDPEVFRANVADVYENAAAPPQSTPDSPETKDGEPFVFDRTMFMNSVHEALNGGSQ